MTKITKEQVVKLRRINPEVRAVEIARKLGVSKERIRQILVALNLPTKIYRPANYCPCGKRIGVRNKYCLTCYLSSKRISIVCAYCGKVFETNKSHRKYKMKHGQKRWFCSNECKYKGSRRRKVSK